MFKLFDEDDEKLNSSIEIIDGKSAKGLDDIEMISESGMSDASGFMIIGKTKANKWMDQKLSMRLSDHQYVYKLWLDINYKISITYFGIYLWKLNFIIHFKR